MLSVEGNDAQPLARALAAVGNLLGQGAAIVVGMPGADASSRADIGVEARCAV
jgi:hypothetical protein